MTKRTDPINKTGIVYLNGTRLNMLKEYYYADDDVGFYSSIFVDEEGNAYEIRWYTLGDFEWHASEINQAAFLGGNQ